MNYVDLRRSWQCLGGVPGNESRQSDVRGGSSSRRPPRESSIFARHHLSIGEIWISFSLLSFSQPPEKEEQRNEGERKEKGSTLVVEGAMNHLRTQLDAKNAN